MRVLLLACLLNVNQIKICPYEFILFISDSFMAKFPSTPCILGHIYSTHLAKCNKVHQQGFVAGIKLKQKWVQNPKVVLF